MLSLEICLLSSYFLVLLFIYKILWDKVWGCNLEVAQFCPAFVSFFLIAIAARKHELLWLIDPNNFLILVLPLSLLEQHITYVLLNPNMISVMFCLVHNQSYEHKADLDLVPDCFAVLFWIDNLSKVVTRSTNFHTIVREIYVFKNEQFSSSSMTKVELYRDDYNKTGELFLFE